MNQPKSKIFAVNLSPNDFSAANEYSDEIIFMTEGVLDFSRLDIYEKKIRFYLENAKETDYLLFSGSTLICAIALKIWFEFQGRCNLLHFEARRYKMYTLFDISPQ